MMTSEIEVRGYARRSKRGVPHAVSPHARRGPRGTFVPSGRSDAVWRPDAVVNMRPREFLRLVGTAPQHFLDYKMETQTPAEAHKEADRFLMLEERMRHGEPLDAPALTIDYELSPPKVIDHQGRHRATIAARLGIPHIPVYLVYVGNTGPIRPGLRDVVPQYTREDYEADPRERHPEEGRRIWQERRRYARLP